MISLESAVPVDPHPTSVLDGDFIHHSQCFHWIISGFSVTDSHYSSSTPWEFSQLTLFASAISRFSSCRSSRNSSWPCSWWSIFPYITIWLDWLLYRCDSHQLGVAPSFLLVPGSSMQTKNDISLLESIPLPLCSWHPIQFLSAPCHTQRVGLLAAGIFASRSYLWR